MIFIPVIGLEIHVQLFTKSKNFCGCSTEFGAPANSNVCPVCLGLPGVLPVLNKKSLDLVIKSALALNCEIAEVIKFDRKNYFYPDLPKNYQISQYDMPIAKRGVLRINDEENNLKDINITRIHLEEDAGKLIHVDKKYSLVDFNRAGIPLMEIVTEPDINSSLQAYDFLDKLKTILRYLEVSDCNMEQGSLRCDANVSVRPEGSRKIGTKTEVKNMNSFKGVKNALDFEIKRHIQKIKKDESVVQETRLWNEQKKITTAMRGKEEAHDYRYFPEPDLVSFEINKGEIDIIKKTLPELPGRKKQRFIKQYDIPEYDCNILISDKELADFFEECVNYLKDFKLISNWIMSQVLEVLNEKKINLRQLNLSPKKFTDLLRMVKENKINTSTAKDVFNQMLEDGGAPLDIVNEKGLLQISDTDKLRNIADKIINNNPQSVQDYKSGKKKALMFMVGQVMRETRGKANPQMVNKILKEKMEGK